LLAVWSDGKKETDEIVSEDESSKASPPRPRRAAVHEGYGGYFRYTTISDQLTGDIAQLDAMDAEVEKLLKSGSQIFHGEG
jgi:hypothetical protein